MEEEEEKATAGEGPGGSEVFNVCDDEETLQGQHVDECLNEPRVLVLC